MDLTLSDVANILKVSKKTIYRWIQQERIPAYRINHQFRFRESEILNWIAQQKTNTTSSDQLATSTLAAASVPATRSRISAPGLFELLKKGGIYYRVEGETAHDAISNAVEVITLPPELQRSVFLAALLERESLATTGIGGSVAVPHPRTPFALSVENQSVNLCFLQNAVDFDALDRKPVTALFLCLSADLRCHLNVLTKIGYLCQDRDFRSLLDRQTGRTQIMDFVESFEQRLQVQS
jgi:PTS system nitrogen regulatory IIA component